MISVSPGTPVVLLHGFGSNGAVFLSYFDIPGAALHALDGAEPDPSTGRRRWFPFSGRTDNLARRVSAAASALEPALAGLDGAVLAGHSQGAMIALALLCRGNLSLRAVWSFAGFLPEPLRIARPPNCEVHLLASHADAFVSIAEVEATARFFAVSATVHFHLAANLTHTFSTAWLEPANFA